MRTDSHGLDFNPFLDVGGASVIGLLVREDGLAAESVDEGGPSCGNHQ